ncbi:MAG: hypothetical protein H6851_08875 [Geminicoccaceae bacterium]|nr:hypothetical protein [Geminicoccaceae bacterium]MCB9943715.1 hypothetical protein [Geminicoccaceae bacterium]
MTCEPKALSALSYTNGFTLWHYRTPDGMTQVDDAGYFNTAASMLRTGDFIFVNANVNTAPSHGMVVVVANDNASVDVSDIVAFGSTSGG